MARSADKGEDSVALNWSDWFRQNLDRRARDAEEYDLHLAAHEWQLASALQINSKDDFESLRFVDVEPFEHQLQNAILFFRQLAPRGLIADDVGLGKTITAGLIATELLHRGFVESLLIVCPKGLASQWQEELKSKFRIEAQVAFGGEFDDLRSFPYWITSYETARSKMAKVIARGFDMLVCDEAHQLKNLYPGPAPMRALKFQELMQREGARFVVMLTATPIQNRLWDIYSQLDILKAPLPNPLGQPDQFKARFIADPPDARRIVKGREQEFRQRVGDATIRTRRKDTKLLFPSRDVQDRLLKPLSEEQAFIERAQQAILALPKLVQVTYMRGLMSSPWAAAESFEKKAQEGGVPGLPASTLLDLAREGRQLKSAAKVKAVIELVREASKQGNPRVIVFTMRLATLRHLNAALEGAGFGDHVGIMSGGNDEGNARAIRDFMAEPPVRPILLASDVGAVGLNLQAGNIVVNYDLPWNPMLIEQRIGRVQRLGQKAKQVLVYNLVLRGTIEEHVVLRLMEKLALFTQAIGEMEELLAGLGLDEEDDSVGFESRLMELIRRSLQQKDIEADLAAMESSRQEAEARLQEVRERNESMLASIRPEASGARLEGLEPAQPRLALRELVLRCLRKANAAITIAEDGTIRIRDQHGRPVELRFEREGFGPSANQSTSHRVMLPGTRAFDQVTKRVREDVVHHVVDATELPAERLQEAVAAHFERIGLDVAEVREVQSRSAVALRVAAKASIQVKGDRYERLLEAELADPQHGATALIGAEALGKQDEAARLPNCERTRLDALSKDLRSGEAQVRESVQSDESFERFRRFYEARHRDAAAALLKSVTGKEPSSTADPVAELRRRAASDAALKAAFETLENRFVPRTSVLPVGVQGLAYAVIDAEATVKHPKQRAAHPLRIQVVPATGKITRDVRVTDGHDAESELHVCPTGHLASAETFLRCHVEGCPAEVCEDCVGKLRGAQRLEACSICDQPTCLGHSVVCSSCGSRVCEAHATKLEDGKSACSNCTKEVADGVWVLERDTEVSVVSGRRGRRSEMIRSAISRQYLFPNEAVKCDDTDRLLAPGEVALDAISGRQLGIDLLEKSVVSGKYGRKSQMLHSALSGAALLSGEERLCDESGCVLLPDEIGYCEETRQHVDPRLLATDVIEKRTVLRRLLAKSDASDQYTRQRNLVSSELSPRRGLPTEIERCPRCGKRALADELDACAESGERLCVSHLGDCEATGTRARSDLLASCEITGKRCRLSQLAICPETGKRALKSLFQPCAASEVACLPEGLLPCAVSGQMVRRSLLTPCEDTGLLAQPHLMKRSAVSGKLVIPARLIGCPATGLELLPEEAVKCSETGVLLHPSAVGTCAVTGQQVRSDLLGHDDVTGQLVSRHLLKQCARTGKRSVEENLAECTVTKQHVLKTELATCEESGRVLLPEELKECAITGKKVHPDLALVCPDTGATLLRSVAEKCSASGVLVSPVAMEFCAASGARVRSGLLALDEFTGARVLASLLAKCEASGKATLATSLQVSAVSGKRFAASVGARCQVTGQAALPSELRTCTRSGRQVLPSLLERCGVSGAMVLPSELVTCEATGTRALPEFTAECAVSHWRVLRSELIASEWSGKLARALFLGKCAATGKGALTEELVASEVSGATFLRERTRRCTNCAKCADLSEGKVCQCCGQFFCRADLVGDECCVCRDLREGIRGRALTSDEVRRFRSLLPWLRRGSTEQIGGLRYILARSGFFDLKRRKAVAVLPAEPGQAGDRLIALATID